MSDGEFNNDTAWQRTRAVYPWPALRPIVTPHLHGWHVHEHAWQDLLGPMTAPIVLEVGAWFGKTGSFLLSLKPGLRLVAIDRWVPPSKVGHHWFDWMAEGRVTPGDTMLDLYRANLWEMRERVVAIRADTSAGMAAVAACGLRPDVVYIDAGHTYAEARGDIELARHLFPGAILCGDDIKSARAIDAMSRDERLALLLGDKPIDGVKWAVEDAAVARGLTVKHDPKCCGMWWRYE